MRESHDQLENQRAGAELRAGWHASFVNSGGSAHDDRVRVDSGGSARDDRAGEGEGGSDEAERAGGTGGEPEDARARAERRRRLDAVFGAAPADPTRDDTAPEPRPTSRDDDWYLENRPPHHG